MVAEPSFIRRTVDSIVMFFVIIITFLRSLFMANPIPPTDNSRSYGGLRGNGMRARDAPINFACGPGG